MHYYNPNSSDVDDSGPALLPGHKNWPQNPASCGTDGAGLHSSCAHLPPEVLLGRLHGRKTLRRPASRVGHSHSSSLRSPRSHLPFPLPLGDIEKQKWKSCGERQTCVLILALAPVRGIFLDKLLNLWALRDAKMQANNLLTHMRQNSQQVVVCEWRQKWAF